MNFSCTRFAIALVFTVTHKFAFGCSGEGVTCERSEVPAKVVTSFRKDPWINFHSSWADRVSIQCKNDVTKLYQGVNAGEMWALRMLDAASGIPPGIMMGNIVDLGAYDECVGVNGHDNPANIQGQHCMVSFTIPSELVRYAPAILSLRRRPTHNSSAGVQSGLTLSVCVPSSCSVEDVFGLVNASIHSTQQFVELEVNVAQVKCSRVESTDNLTTGIILTISLFVVIVSLLLSCTICDFVVKAGYGNGSPALKTLAKFSLYTNTIKLLSTEVTPGTIPAIHGIRFLSTCHLLIAHREYLTRDGPLINLSDINNSATVTFSAMGPTSVETFFILSGFLVAFTFLKKLRSSAKFSLLEFYVHRYIRLTPSIGAILLYTIFILPYAGTGPLKQSLIETTEANCQKNWLMNFLYAQNLVDRSEMCLQHTWHVAVDMQYFILSPLVLYPLFYRPKIGLTMLGVLAIASFVAPALQIVNDNYAFLGDPTKRIDTFNTYFMSHNRALPYLIGIFLGYDAANNKKRVTKVQAAFSWILACISMVICSWTPFFIQPTVVTYNNLALETVFVSVGRLGLIVAVAWIIYACTRGYGGPVTRFFSLPIFLPLSRLSYAINLVHVSVLGYSHGTIRAAEFQSTASLISKMCGDMAFSILAAAILYLCIETPSTILNAVMRGNNQPAAISNRAPAKKTDNLSCMIREYLDLVKGQATSDPLNDTKIPQMGSWRTISDILNTLSNRPTKTPAEWAKTWWEWRRNSQGKTHPEYIDGKPAQFQTADLTPEQELFTFLIAVAHGLDDTAGSKQLNFVEHTSGQLDAHDLPNTDRGRSSTFELDSIGQKINVTERNDTQIIVFPMSESPKHSNNQESIITKYA